MEPELDGPSGASQWAPRSVVTPDQDVRLTPVESKPPQPQPLREGRTGHSTSRDLSELAVISAGPWAMEGVGGAGAARA